MSEERTAEWKSVFEDACRRARRVVILGVGNEWRGDDGAGILLIRELQKRFRDSDRREGKQDKDWLLIEGGDVPESETGRIRNFRPDLVVIVDAARGGGNPGTVHLIDKDRISEEDITTHRTPLSFLARFIEESIGARVLIIGFEPKAMEWNTPPSPSILKTITILGEYFSRFFK